MTDKPFEIANEGFSAEPGSEDTLTERFNSIHKQGIQRSNDIHHAQMELINISRAREHVREQFAEREAVFAKKVASETTPMGKPLFPNEEARKSEVFLRLREDETAQQMNTDNEQFTAGIEKLKCRIEHLGRLDRWSRLEVEMMIAVIKSIQD